jgi:hypothetical protein
MQFEQKKRRSLTSPDAGSRLSLPIWASRSPAAQTKSNAGYRFDAINLRSRNVYAPPQMQALAGVFLGLIAEAFFRSRQPTRQNGAVGFLIFAQLANPLTGISMYSMTQRTRNMHAFTQS